MAMFGASSSGVRPVTILFVCFFTSGALGLFPYNSTFGDTVERNGDDNAYTLDTLPQPIVYFTLKYTENIYISSNGYISFTRPFFNTKGRPFSEDFFIFEEGLLTVLWTDLIFNNTGSLYHRVSTDAEDLRLIKDMIAARNSMYCQYEPTVVVVVTWENATYNTHIASMQQLVTFQVVIATDGRATFAALIYLDPVDVLRLRGYVGFFGNRRRFYNANPRLLEEVNLFRIDGNCITDIAQDEDPCPLSSLTFECPKGIPIASACQCDQPLVLPDPTDSTGPTDTTDTPDIVGSADSSGITTTDLLTPDDPTDPVDTTDPADPVVMTTAQPDASHSCVRELGAEPEVDTHLCLDFFPFGERNGDARLLQAVDRTDGPFELPVPVTIYQKREYQYYVSTNGYVSFDRPPAHFRLSSFPASTVTLVAALWADLDFRDSGSVYHRATNDSYVLNEAAVKIAARNPDFASYRPTLCVVVTWSQAVVFSETYIDTVQTFQLVLATDGRTTFAILMYEDTARTVQIATDQEDIGVIGFDAGDLRRSIAILSKDNRNFTLESFNVFRIDGNCITDVYPEDVCQLNSLSLECEGEHMLTASSCLCEPGFTGDNSTCKLDNFLPFGVDINDEIGPRDIDGVTGPIALDVPIVFYQRKESTIYISTNGLIMFGPSDEFKSHAPQTLPRGGAPFIPLIAPYWSDLNFRDYGTVFYRVARDNSTLDEISSSLHPNYADFRPTLAVVVTWFESKLLRHNHLFSFQAVLATDGDISFAIFHYEIGNQVLSLKPTGGSRIRIGVIGFDAGNKLSATEAEIRSDKGMYIGMFRIDGNCVNELLTSDGFQRACEMDSIPFRCPSKTFDFPLCSCPSGATSEHQCVEYLEHGQRVGDGMVPLPESVASSNSAALNLSVPVVFYRREHWTLNAFSDGYMTLGGLSSVEFARLPVPLPNASSIIAPLWIAPAQDVSLNLITNNFYYRHTTNPADLSNIRRRLIESNQDLTDFQPEAAVVTTMFLNAPNERVRFALFQPGPNVTSVQTVLATDGDVSFAIFIYEGAETMNFPYQIGFDAGDQERYSIINGADDRSRVERSTVVYRIDGNCITSTSPGSMCALNSVATECNGLSATQCECKQGYQSISQVTCIDIDECSSEMNGCNQICINLNGNYSCACWEGYQLQEDGATCRDIDECESGLHHCAHTCVNTDGNFTCLCDDGYELQSDGGSCRDVDECFLDRYPCSKDADCNNTEGSHTCACKPGFAGDGQVCDPLDVIDGSGDPQVFIAIGLSVAATGIMVVVALFIVLCLKYRLVILKRLQKRTNDGTDSESSKENDYSYFRRRLTVQSSFTSSIPKSLIVPSCNLKLGDSIGQGEFGIVYKAQIKSGFADTISETVAVKTLKGFVEDELVNDLIKECARMHRFEHPNVLKLSGVCLDGGPAPYIIMPFMENGSLLKYLRDNRASLVLDQSAVTEEVDALNKRLMDMSIQVGKGMEYLASKRVVHRDLAARNCMIDINFVIKVADFGLSESIDTTKEYFRQDHEAIIKLPIKWLAPESINDGVFSEKSDVWSYGVTCWEIFSGGKTPYPGIHPADLPRQLDAGYRMDRPINSACSDDIYKLMLDCWNSRAEGRPSFSEVVVQLTSRLAVAAHYMDFSPTTTEPKKLETNNVNGHALS